MSWMDEAPWGWRTLKSNFKIISERNSKSKAYIELRRLWRAFHYLDTISYGMRICGDVWSRTSDQKLRDSRMLSWIESSGEGIRIGEDTHGQEPQSLRPRAASLSDDQLVELIKPLGGAAARATQRICKLILAGDWATLWSWNWNFRRGHFTYDNTIGNQGHLECA